jgi:phage terminase Nu1 subunit (DNA packaging protein)
MNSALPSDVTGAELMRLLGVTRPRVTQLAADGIVIRTGRDRYELASITRYCAWLRKGNQGGAWNEARTALALERAASARLDRQEREGQVVRIDEVRTCWTGIARVIRDRVLGLARKVAPRLVGLKSAAGVETILYRECCECLEELASMEIGVRKVANGKGQDERVGAR